MNMRNGRTLSEEEIIYHEGRTKMKKKLRDLIASYKQNIWQIRAQIYHGELTSTLEIQNALKYGLESKTKD